MKSAVVHQRGPYPHEEGALDQLTSEVSAEESSSSASPPREQLELVNQAEVERLSAGGIVLFAAGIAMIIGVVLHGLDSPKGPRVRPAPSYPAQYSPYGNQTTARWVK